MSPPGSAPGLSLTMFLCRLARPARRRPSARVWLFEPLEPRVVPATIEVTTLADAGSGSLRNAIARANLDPRRDTITFAPTVTGAITLQSALPDLSTAIDIAGPGASALAVARSAAAGTPEFRIFTVPAGSEVMISGLTLRGGLAFQGGGIYNAGTLTVNTSTLDGNMTTDNRSGNTGIGGGAGIYNTGSLTVTASTLSGNRASFFFGSISFSPGRGGGIYNFGALTVIASTLSGNSASAGGGIASEGGMLTVDTSTFSTNSARGSGGGIYHTGGCTVTASTFRGNTAGSGGGISNLQGTLTVTASTFSENITSGAGSLGGAPPGLGGGIENTGTLTITASTLSSNSASFGAAPGGLGVYPSSGGGIWNSGTLTVDASTLSGNTAGSGGGIWNSGTLTVDASTLSNNQALSGFSGFGRPSPPGQGGGIFNSGTLTVDASTLSGNTANGGPGGGIYVAMGSNRGALTVLSSLFASGEGGNLVTEGGTFTSRGHNLFTDTPAVALDPTDLVNTDPRLGPLADNGGPTLTHAPLPGSPAIDAGAAAPGVRTDQRGVPRPQGAAPDIGSVERVEQPFVQLTPGATTRRVGATHTVTATVLDRDFIPLAGVPVTFRVLAGPNAGAAGVTDPADGRTDVAGRARFTYAGAVGVGTDVIVATAAVPGGPTVTSAEVTADWLAVVISPVGVAPTVVGLRRLGVHRRPTRLVLAFSAPLDPDLAADRGNYALVRVGPAGRPARRPKPVPLVAAVYDPAAQTVTLATRRRLGLHRFYRLTVKGAGPGGLTGPMALRWTGLAPGGRGWIMWR